MPASLGTVILDSFNSIFIRGVKDHAALLSELFSDTIQDTPGENKDLFLKIEVSVVKNNVNYQSQLQ